jgi:hypothetical protein
MISNNTNNKISVPRIVKSTSLIALFVTLLMAMPTMTIIVSADDIIVDDDGTGDYLSIQDAINNANPGDTIWVKDGSYNEPLTISVSQLKIIADNGAEPIIYLTSYSPGISIQADAVIIEGFKIYGNSNPLGGPVIQATASSMKSEIRDNEFTVISGETGTSVLLVETGAEEVVFKSNTVKYYDIGVELENGANAVISSNTFTSVNYSIYHGANVDGTLKWYGTIQDAIDDADADDSVSVVPGPFTENIIINKSIDFYGYQKNDNPVNGRTGRETVLDGDTTSTIVVSQGTENVTIDGFTITMPNKTPVANAAGIRIDPGCHNIQVTNNIFENITDTSSSDTLADETYAVMVWGRDDALGGQSHITIEDNLIQNVEEYGIAINDNTSHVTITGNKIIDLLGADHSADPSWPDPSWPDIICSAIHLGGQVGPISQITIEDNILMTEQMGDGTITVAGSGVSFAGVDEWVAPNRVWNGFDNVTIESNIMINNSMGVIVLIGNGTDTILVTDNDLSGNTEFGVNNLESDLHIDATNNWWGNISGPYNLTDNPTGIGTAVEGNVTYWPWYEFNGYSIMPFVDYDVGNPQVDFGDIIKDYTEIEIDATDNESGILFITYRIWNTTHRWSPWMNYTAPFTFNSEGIHRVQVNATDVAGTSSYIGPFVYYEHRVDDVSPTVELEYPNGGEFIYGTVPIQWDAYDEIYDQGQLAWNNSISLTEDYPGHIQSFIPTQDSINSVQLLLYGDYANVSVKLFSSINPVPTALAQSSKTLEDIGSESSPEWVDFPFSSSIDLDTTQTYYVGVTQEILGDTGFQWYYYEDSSNDRYPYGHAWIKAVDELINESDIDFGYKTLYWRSDLGITVQYSPTGVAPWSTIVDGEPNDGVYEWDTANYGIPDGEDYRVRVLATDKISNIGSDESDQKFIIDNQGPGVYNIVITDTTISNTQYTKNGDNLEITASVGGDPEVIMADLSSFGKGTAVPPTSYTGGVAKWIINEIITAVENGPISVTITAADATGDSGVNSGSIIADNEDPEITVLKPRAGLYLLDSMRLLPFSYPFIIGQITIETDAFDNISGVKQVDFYLENELEASVIEPPYRWLWDRAATGFFDLEIIASDNVGHSVSYEISDLFIINLDIIGHN